MVIVDTSVWIEFLRANHVRLGTWMAADLILQHPFVTAEIGMGSFRSTDERSRTIDLLDSFARIEVADMSALHDFISENALFGTGIGFADALLLHACADYPAIQLATRDKRLAQQAQRLGIEVID